MKPNDLNSVEYPEYYQYYIDQLPQADLLSLMRNQKLEMLSFLAKLQDDSLNYSYAEGKWTVAEVMQHIIDTERIFQYRALCIARKDKTLLPGYDQDAYVPFSGANDRSVASFIIEYQTVRDSGISLFQTFTPSMLNERGNSNGQPLSTAAAGFIIAGHEKHHLTLFKINYNL